VVAVPRSKDPVLEYLAQHHKLDEWQRYEGPQGGRGWINTITGEKVYQEEKPGGGSGVEDTQTAQPAQPLDRDDMQTGDEFLYYNEDDDTLYEGVVTDVNAYGPQVFLGPDRDDKSESFFTGPLPPTVDVYPADDPEGALIDAKGELVDDVVEEVEEEAVAQVEPHESFENPPRGFKSVGLDEAKRSSVDTKERLVVFPDGTQYEITDISRSTVKFKTQDGEERLQKDAPELDGAFVLEETRLSPDEFTSEERIAVAVSLARNNGPKSSNGFVLVNWEQWGEVFDHATDEELAEALLLSSVSTQDDPGITGKYWNRDETEFNTFMNNKVEIREYTDDKPSYRDSHTSLGPITSRMSKDALLNAVDNTMAELEGKEGEGARVKRRNLLRAAFLWTSEPGVREELAEKYDKERWLKGGLLSADSKESLKDKFIRGWHYYTDSDTAFMVQHVLKDIGPNKDNPSAAWTDGNSVSDVYIPDEIKRYAQELYEETQSKLPDKPKKLYRGVTGPVATHGNLESWSELKHIAEEFAGEDFGYVMEAEVDPEDVWCTWETLGDDWPEEEVLGKKEWMVLGGALA